MNISKEYYMNLEGGKLQTQLGYGHNWVTNPVGLQTQLGYKSSLDKNPVGLQTQYKRIWSQLNFPTPNGLQRLRAMTQMEGKCNKRMKW